MSLSFPMFSYPFETKLEKVTFYSLFLFMLLVPFSRAFVSFCVFYFPVLLFLNFGVKGVLERLRQTPVVLSLALFVGYMTLTLLWTEHFDDADGILKLYFLLSLVPSIGFLVKREWLKPLVLAFLCALCVSSVLSMGHYLEWWQIKDKTQVNTSPFMNSIHYSMFMAVGAISSLYFLIMLKIDWLKKSLFLALFLLFTVTLFLSDGRTGQLSFLVAVCLLIVMLFRNNMKLFLSVTILFVLSLYSLYTLIPRFESRVNAVVRNLTTLENGSFDTSVGRRIAYWLLAKEIVLDYPLFGVGFGDYKLGAKEVLEKKDFGMDEAVKAFVVSRHFHNQYLMAVVQGGLIGLILLLNVFASLYRLSIETPVYRHLSILLLSVYAVGCLTEPLLILQNPLTVFALVVGFSVVATQPKEYRSLLKKVE
ncbi:O-antigen ligase family protein [Sulfurospirillum barnesii]|uniref:Lipid A core-O-antigen ligase-like enyme n=1 Tax=Sulfurospirillum barnesii (strain ATCC 700032 / DSM 10660 / SES-3) TaxID=760154 RepID=I3XZ11_SULBS|nr:O-antigen ligase family protein [Sulfurospirillum barnesii]AFL69185.1 lipid A core-O-antigen ligase-like enyme [Sulfurospirillum barnesii SES-3]